jgi:hypothetical protein
VSARYTALKYKQAMEVQVQVSVKCSPAGECASGLAATAKSGIERCDQRCFQLADRRSIHAEEDTSNLQEVVDDPGGNKMLLVMDYMEGGPVLTREGLERGRRIPEPLALQYFRDMCKVRTVRLRAPTEALRTWAHVSEDKPGRVSTHRARASLKAGGLSRTQTCQILEKSSGALHLSAHA